MNHTATAARPSVYPPRLWAELQTLPPDDLAFVSQHPLPASAIAALETAATFTERRAFPELVERAFGLNYEPRPGGGWGMETVRLGRVAAWRSVHGIVRVWRRMHDRRWGGGKR